MRFVAIHTPNLFFIHLISDYFCNFAAKITNRTKGMKQTTANTAPINQGLHTFRGALQRLSLTLLLMLLTTASAWALKAETTSYVISFTNGQFKIINVGSSETYSWDATISGTNAYWKANDGHEISNDVSITPNQNVFYSNVTSVGIHTTYETKFTFKAPYSIAITNVTFKNGSSVVKGTNSESGSTYTVTLPSGSSFDGFEVTYGTISGKCGDNANWTLSKQDGQYTKLTISGSGAMNTYGNDGASIWHTNAPWGYDLTSVTIDNNVTSIGTQAFIGCQSLSSLTIGSSVTTIGTNAFDHCDELTEVTLPASVTTINDAAFKNCGKLQRVNIQHDGAVSLGSNVFQNCGKLQYIVFPNPAAALANTTGNWSGLASKLRVALGSQLFTATNQGGTAAYAITNESDLRNLASAINDGSEGITNGKTFRQTGDITLSSTQFDPIGYNDYHYFTGTYDGGGYTISGLYTGNFTDRNLYGLFGYVKNGTVKNVRLVSPTVSGSAKCAGALIGKTNNATVNNCVVFSPTIGGANSKGVIIGSVSGGTLLNLYFYDGNLNNAIGGGASGTNVGRVRKVILGSGIASVSPAINPTATSLDNGFVYKDNLYYREGLALTLTTSLNIPAGYHAVYKADGNNITSPYTVSSSDVTLTAQKVANTYTVKFYANGGSGSMSNQVFTYGTAQNLTANAFTRTGYTFAGWNTQADGNGTSYSDKESVKNLTTTNGGTVNLYAKWTANTYTVTFDRQGGNGGSTSATATYDAAMPAITVPTRTGYTFGGYYTETNGGGTQYYKADGTSAKSWNIAEATKLYAKWTATDYAITYDLDGGSVTTANPTTYNVETPTFTLNNPTKAGYTFIGWTEGNDNTLMPTVTITKGSSTKDLNYTANYEIARFTQGSLSYEWTGSGTEVEVTACDPSVTSVTIPATVSNDNVTYNVTAIEADAFSGCTDLTSVALYPATPPTLGSGVFSGCTSLNTIYVPSGSAAAYKTAAGWSGYAAKIQGFDGTCGDNVYYAYDSNATTLNIFGTGSMTDYSTTNSPWFSYRMSIKTVVIGNGVTTIGNYAFYSCTSLESITIPDGVTSIGEAAFYSCTSLNSITIPDGVTSIGFDAFGHCTSLNSITIPDGVTSIGNGAFYCCTGLTSIEIPASVTTIDDQAFRDCSKLTSVTIYAPKLDTYGYTVFKDNASGRKIYVPKNSVDTYKSYASKMSFDENDIVGFDGKWGTNVYYAYENDTKTLNIFGTGAMKDDASPNRPWHSYCKDITKVIISDGVTRIGEAAFYDCSSLESVKIPVSVTRIGNYAFYYCSSLESIEIPASVTRIDRFAFAHCTNLLAVILNSETPPTLVSNAFSACTALNAIVVPEDVVAAYKAADGWKDYEDKICNKYGSYGDNVYYAYNSTTTTLNIFGTGAMADYNSLNRPWNSYCEDITTVVIGNGVTSIGDNAFGNCTVLTSIIIPASVTSIGSSAFGFCASLNSITIPASVTNIGNSAFQCCTSLESITIPGDVTSIGSRVFYGCTSLNSIEIPVSVTTIGDYSFYGCNSLENIEIPASVTTIGRFAFNSCTGLTSIEIPANVTQISSNPFRGCSSLKTISVASENTKYDSRNNCNALIETATNTLIQGCNNSVIPNGVTYIGYDAFYGCTGLTSIDIPASVTAIYGKAFMGCTGLTSIEIPASVTNIDQWAFDDCTSLNSVTIYAPELSKNGYGYGAFYNNADGRKIYVFKNCLDTYKERAWKTDDDWGMGFYENDIEAITDINLRDNDDNRSLVEAANDNALGALNVTLKGRKLYKDGAWNTLCLPFAVTIKGSVLDGDDVKAMVLDKETSGLNGDELTLNFVDAPATIPAGTPFIIKWKQAAILENPAFNGVTIDKTAPEVAFNGGWFEGTYSPVNWAVEDQNILFLGDANTLYYPKAGAHLNAFRAYFLLEDDSNFGAREIVVNFGEETTGVVSMHNSECLMLNKADAWYTVNGVKLDGKPTAKGMYIHGGRKVVIK